jgi:transposase
MNRVPRYTKEFREQAVKLVLVDGLSQREAAGRLSISVKTLGGCPAPGGVGGAEQNAK